MFLQELASYLANCGLVATIIAASLKLLPFAFGNI